MLVARGVACGATIVGHSLGGLVAVALSERHPNAVGNLVLISTAPSFAYASLGWRERLAFLPILGSVAWRLAGDRQRLARSRVLFGPGFEPPHELLTDMSNTAYASLRRSSRMGVAYIRQRSIDARLRACLPVTIVLGAKDRTIDADAAATAWRSRNRQVVLLKATGHCPHVELPTEIAQIIMSVASRPRD
jgi:pimeloyl-ACP methyl ester carboxylesterase